MSQSKTTPLPEITALFLVQFDNRKGYTLSWHRTKDPSQQLEGIIEFKCLPSGLHNVKEDSIYFVHDDQLGLAAFASGEASEAERNARFVSVGMLTQHDTAWVHAEALRDLAQRALSEEDIVQSLEEFWESSISSAGQDMAPASLAHRNDDLAGSASSMLQSLGPLIFPIYRASLLRKRVLLISQPPLLPVCHFVHLLSQCSAFPPEAQNGSSDDTSSLKPLYTVGVHDITELSSSSSWAGVAHDTDESGNSPLQNGWIACTSDELLSTKTQLSEVRIKFQNTATPHSSKSAWPTIAQSAVGNTEIPLLATRRDLQRWEMLVEHMAGEIYNTSSADTPEADHTNQSPDDDDDDRTHLIATSTTTTTTFPRSAANNDTSTIIEPLSWSASLAQYSARSTLDAERMHDCDEAVLSIAITASADDIQDVDDNATARSRAAAAAAGFVQAYFRECTKRMFDVIRARMDNSGAASTPYRDDVEDETEDETAPLRGRSDTAAVANAGDEAEVVITREDMIVMGLDVWSASDIKFVQEMGRLWFARRVVVQAGEVEVCGVRVW